MLTIGVTGSLGTGKTLVASLFKKFGARVLDADRIAHELIRPGQEGYRQIVRYFKGDILTGKRIDRAKLAQRVFGDPRDRRRLEEILHPRVLAVIRAKTRVYRRLRRIPAVIWDVPLLFETGWDRHVDVTVMVRARRAVQLERVALTRPEALRRIRAQLPQREKIARADFVVDNNGSIRDAERQVLNIWNQVQEEVLERS